MTTIAKVKTADMTIEAARTIGTFASPRRFKERIRGKPIKETPSSPE